jgi:hypothetical protein
MDMDLEVGGLASGVMHWIGIIGYGMRVFVTRDSDVAGRGLGTMRTRMGRLGRIMMRTGRPIIGDS